MNVNEKLQSRSGLIQGRCTLLCDTWMVSALEVAQEWDKKTQSFSMVWTVTFLRLSSLSPKSILTKQPLPLYKHRGSGTGSLGKGCWGMAFILNGSWHEV